MFKVETFWTVFSRSRVKVPQLMDPFYMHNPVSVFLTPINGPCEYF